MVIAQQASSAQRNSAHQNAVEFAKHKREAGLHDRLGKGLVLHVEAAEVDHVLADVPAQRAAPVLDLKVRAVLLRSGSSFVFRFLDVPCTCGYEVRIHAYARVSASIALCTAWSGATQHAYWHVEHDHKGHRGATRRSERTSYVVDASEMYLLCSQQGTLV